jgi:hypothetical protein
MTAPFSRRLVVRWCDVDGNAHLRITANSEEATDSRVSLLASFADLAALRRSEGRWRLSDATGRPTQPCGQAPGRVH